MIQNQSHAQQKMNVLNTLHVKSISLPHFKQSRTGEPIINENSPPKKLRPINIPHKSQSPLSVKQVPQPEVHDMKKIVVTIPEAPTYYPTLDEFKCPLKYISQIRPVAEQFGICKIVPPRGWSPPRQISFSETFKIATKSQDLDLLTDGDGFEDGQEYTVREYQEMAERFSRAWSEKYYHGQPLTYENLVRDYWTMVETRTGMTTVEYANDIDTLSFKSGFPPSSLPPPSTGTIPPPTLPSDPPSFSPTSSPITSPISPSSGSDIESTSSPEGEADPSILIKIEPQSTPTVKPETESDPNSNTSPSSPPSNPPSNPPSTSIPFEEFEDESKEGPLFTDDYYSRTAWNLQNIARCKGSLMRHITSPITGVNVPWLYFGMLFATFCWHLEDNNFYSINYSHFGAVKQWYGIPGSQYKSFERVFRASVPHAIKKNPDLLHHITTQLPPTLFLAQGVPVFQAHQTPGSFIVTFPRSYHAGFSYGFNCGEAVNFALPDWLDWGAEADEAYRRVGRGSVIRLSRELEGIIKEEVEARPSLHSLGIRDLSSALSLPKNDFRQLNEKSLDFDELRECAQCKHCCLFSAVACACNEKKVGCIRHPSCFCQCPNNNKFMLEWCSSSELSSLLSEVRALKTSLPCPAPAPPPTFSLRPISPLNPSPSTSTSSSPSRPPLKIHSIH